MIVIADTSPVNYLVLIGVADVLRRLYGRVVIPEAVFRELQHPEAPAPVLAWMAERPFWIEIGKAISEAPDAGLQSLGEGERQAIVLAQQHWWKHCCLWTRVRDAAKLFGASFA
jgi:predicted nucleic acid-binding protein